MEGSELGIVGRGFGSWYVELGGGGIHDLKGFPGASEKVGRRGDWEENSVGMRVRISIGSKIWWSLVGSSSGGDWNGGGRSEVEIGRGSLAG